MAVNGVCLTATGMCGGELFGADVMEESLRRSSLGERDVTAILLEGGPHLAGAFFDAGDIDEVRLFLAPILVGGRAARDPMEGGGVEKIADATRALTLDCEHVGEDVLISARLREW